MGRQNIDKCMRDVNGGTWISARGKLLNVLAAVGTQSLFHMRKHKSIDYYPHICVLIVSWKLIAI